MTAIVWGALLVAGLLGLGWWRSNAAHGRALAQLLAAQLGVALLGLHWRRPRFQPMAAPE